jgi:hypothetical protein
MKKALLIGLLLLASGRLFAQHRLWNTEWKDVTSEAGKKAFLTLKESRASILVTDNNGGFISFEIYAHFQINGSTLILFKLEFDAKGNISGRYIAGVGDIVDDKIILLGWIFVRDREQEQKQREPGYYDGM